jgi:thioredoxin reductase
MKIIEKQVLVIGSGPAGLAAAIEAAKAGAEVLIVDENMQAGGQLFKQIHKFFGSSAHHAGVRGIDIGRQLLKEATSLGVETWLNSAVIGIFDGKTVAIDRGFDYSQKTVVLIRPQKIVVATGASEKAVSFEGWTLPGVMGAGAAQTMINVNRVLPGERILMVGSGNVGLIVSYQLLQAGAEVVGILEAAPKIGGYGVHAAKIRRAGVPIKTSHTVLKAGGETSVEWATVCEVDDNWQPVSGTEKTLEIDAIAIAVGLKPLIQLIRQQGCECSYVPELGGWTPIHDRNMETTKSGIYVAGDAAGVEEANTALEEGRLAGIAAAKSLGYLSDAKAIELTEETWKRLDDLRKGPFGETRLMAKKRLLQKGREKCEAV